MNIKTSTNRSALVRCFLAHEYVACLGGRSRINRHITFVDVLNDAVFVDNECGSIAEALLFVKETIVFHNGPFEITEEWKGDADVLRETPVGRNTVDANTKHLSIGTFEFCDISLIRF